MAKLLILGILFLIAIRPAAVAKLIILDISPLISFILALREELVTKIVILGILSSMLLILALYTSCLTTTFSAISLSLIKKTETGSNVSTSYLSTLLLKLSKLVNIFLKLLISNLSTLDFKLVKKNLCNKRWYINSCCVFSVFFPCLIRQF